MSDLREKSDGTKSPYILHSTIGFHHHLLVSFHNKVV